MSRRGVTQGLPLAHTAPTTGNGPVSFLPEAAIGASAEVAGDNPVGFTPAAAIGGFAEIAGDSPVGFTPAASIFLPTQLSGLVLWLQAGMGITLNGSNVSTWADQSGQGNDLTQGTAGSQPAFEAAGYNGKPSVAFDGTADWLGGTGASLLAAASGDDVAQTVFFACQRTASATDVWFRWDHSTGLGIHQVYHVTDNLVAYRAQDSGASSNPTINTGGVDSTRARWILVYSGTAWTVYKNGTPTGPTACNVAAATLDQYSLGGDRAAANAAALRVAEHGVYNRAITAGEVAQLDAYLARYG